MSARSENALKAVEERCRAAGASDVCILPADLSVLEGLEALAGQAWDAFGGVDVFLANAGLYDGDDFETMTVQ